MTATDMYPLMLETMQAFALHYQDTMQRANADVGLQGRNWGMLFLVRGAEPEPALAEELHPVAPFLSVETIERELKDLASRGFVAASGPDYRLTDAGRRALMVSIEAARARLALLDPLPPAEMRRTVELLRRIVYATADAPQPPEKPHLARSRSVAPGEDAPAATLIDQYLTDLALFRDDAHTEAWRPFNLAGSTWETFTYLWRGEADTVDTLAERLVRREHPRDVYLQALDDLVTRGWVAEETGRYSLTDQGRAIREEAEQATNRVFYAAWSCLNDDELDELRGLPDRHRDSLRRMVNEPIPA